HPQSPASLLIAPAELVQSEVVCATMFVRQGGDVAFSLVSQRPGDFQTEGESVKKSKDQRRKDKLRERSQREQHVAATRGNCKHCGAAVKHKMSPEEVAQLDAEGFRPVTDICPACFRKHYRAK